MEPQLNTAQTLKDGGSINAGQSIPSPGVTTDNEARIVGRYLNEAGGYTLLGAEKEKTLAKRRDHCFGIVCDHLFAHPLGVRTLLDQWLECAYGDNTGAAKSLVVTDYLCETADRWQKPRGARDPVLEKRFSRVTRLLAALGQGNERQAANPNWPALLEQIHVIMTTLRYKHSAIRRAVQSVLSVTNRCETAIEQLQGWQGAAENSPFWTQVIDLETRIRLPIARARDIGIIIRTHWDTYERAIEHLVESNLRLVVKVARGMGGELSLADRIQEGNLGLIRAAEKFDGRSGYRFTTYATYWIKNFIQRGIMNQGHNIRVPVHTQERIRRVRNSASQETQETQETREYDMQGEAALAGTISLDEPVGEGDGSMDSAPPRWSLLPDPGALTADALASETLISRLLREALHTLSPAVKPIMEQYFGLQDPNGEERSQKAIAAEEGISVSVCRARLNEGLTQLRTFFQERGVSAESLFGETR